MNNLSSCRWGLVVAIWLGAAVGCALTKETASGDPDPDQPKVTDAGFSTDAGGADGGVHFSTLVKAGAQLDGSSSPRADASLDPDEARTLDSELCGACNSPLGGETGDFLPGSGSQVPQPICTDTIRELDADADAGSEVNAFVAEVEGSFELAARWDELPGAVARPAAGYSPSTTVELNVHVLRAQRVEREPIEAQDAELCASYVQLVTEIELVAADGSLHGNFESTLVPRAEGVWEFSALRTANQFTGTLDLGARAEDGEFVVAALSLYFYDGTLRGALSPSIITPVLERVPDGGDYEWVNAVQLRFPDDACPLGDRPLEDDELQALTSGLRTLVEDSNPSSANHWRGLDEVPLIVDGGVVADAELDPDRPTDVSFTFGDVTDGCQRLAPTSSEAIVSFHASVDLDMADEWVHWETPVQGSARIDADGEFERVTFSAESEPSTAIDFEADFGISDIDVPKGHCAQINVFSEYERIDTAPTTYGKVEVNSGPCDTGTPYFGNRTLALVSWCDGCEFEPWPSFVPHD